MCLLNDVWPKGDLRVRQPVREEAIQELLECIALMPLATSDLRAEIDKEVTVSDASEAGGGLCCSGQLTDEGETLLQTLQSPKVRKERMIPFTAQGQMPTKRQGGPRVFVLSLFDGIGALMLGYRCKWWASHPVKSTRTASACSGVDGQE